MVAELKPFRIFVDPTVLRLGKWLRYLGLDVPSIRSARELPDGELLLTKKRAIRGVSGKIVHVPFERIHEQLSWFVKRFPGVIDVEKLGSRCIRCNRVLVEIEREKARDRVPDYVYMTHRRFKMCTACGKIYWRGTHPERMRRYLQDAGIFARGVI